MVMKLLVMLLEILNLIEVSIHSWECFHTFKVGDQIECVITDIDKDKRRVAISYRLTTENPFDSLEKNSIDFYASVKSLYLQDRQQKILNTNKIIETQDDSDWEEIETQ